MQHATVDENNDAGAAYVYDISGTFSPRLSAKLVINTPDMPITFMHSTGSSGKTNVQKLTSDAPSVSAKYGESVSISGGRLVVGAPSSSSGVCSCFHLYVFSLLLSILVSQVFLITIPFKQVGNVYLYYRDRMNNWILSEKIKPLDPGAGSGQGIRYGQSVSVSLNALAVGAPENDLAAENSGSVFIYDVVEDKCDTGTSSLGDALKVNEPL